MDLDRKQKKITFRTTEFRDRIQMLIRRVCTQCSLRWYTNKFCYEQPFIIHQNPLSILIQYILIHNTCLLKVKLNSYLTLILEFKCFYLNLIHFKFYEIKKLFLGHSFMKPTLFWKLIKSLTDSLLYKTGFYNKLVACKTTIFWYGFWWN